MSQRRNPKFQKVVILGGGTMGVQIGLQSAASGFDVSIFDPFESALESAQKRMPDLAQRLVRANRITPDQAKQGLARIHFTSDPETAGKNADFINESVPEDPRIKQEVFSLFNPICPEHTIFTTNTSTLVPSMISEATGRPDRFCALHFHDLQTTNVVDIMPHPGTSSETLGAVRDFCTAIDQFPIELKKEQHGYVFNTMLSEWMGSALTLAARQVADVRDIDRAWMGIMRTLVGPFGIMDSIGLGTVYQVTDYWAKKKKDPQGQRNAAFLKSYVDRGELGIKTKKGFYTYPHPEFMDPEFLKGIK
ncbi:MAG: 3-hydroxyacyl-CoA dehydrogenase [Desulfobacter sp.]|nr:MAG: 3-hydroxyacyl-CoA dehydrogenase [Desulfobacter sp.]